jgi:hypothetical protein
MALRTSVRLALAALVTIGGGLLPAVQVQAAEGSTFHVRHDGGTAVQCTGRADAPYPGSGRDRACAWASPLVALPPGEAPRIDGGDTLRIHRGRYRIGFGAPGAQSCNRSWTYDCFASPVPSGTAARPTRILGAGHRTGCARPPELWGTERTERVLNLDGSDHVVVACLDITDHDGCVLAHSDPDLTCQRDRYPHGDWAKTGIYAADSTDVTLRDLDVHGLAHTGVHAGRLRDWTLRRVRLATNGWAGWDGDLGGPSSNRGRLRFVRWTVEYNGCGETYPGLEPTGCWAQTAGGYGDGVGTAATAGRWLIRKSVFRHNTSDGLDLLYHSDGGWVRLDRVRAEGNAGNQLKTTGSTRIRNSVIVADCRYFAGKPFTHHVDHCRAAGDAVALVAAEGQRVRFVHNTVVAGGNCILLGQGPPSAALTIRNNILVGGRSGDDEFSCYRYVEGGMTVSEGWNVIHDARSHDCPGRGTVCRNPRLRDDSFASFDPRLRRSSPAVDSARADRHTPAVDFFGQGRPAAGQIDRGAVER